MKDYTWYLWGSYGVTALCLALELIVLAKRAREAKA